eukprot:s4086_g1.t2
MSRLLLLLLLLLLSLLLLLELIGSSSFRILTCTEAGGVAMRLMKRTCKPQHAFLNLDAAMAGHGHCDIHHKVCTSGTETSGSEETSIMSEDLLFGSFPCEPFLNQDPARPSCFDDPRSKVFKLLRKHMVVQKPRAALLLAECWQELPEASRPSVKSFLLDGKDPRIMESDEQALWGLRYLDGYGAAFLEVPLAACGVPLAGQEAMIVLIRDDCGGASAAEVASQLVKTMLSSEPLLLERCSIHALMFSGEDDRVVQAQQAAREAYKKGKSRRRSQNATMRRKMTTEVRELGLQPGEAPYTDHLNGIRIAAARMGQQGQTSADKWIRQVPDEKAVHLNLLFARARQHGLDLQNLCVDLSQGFSATGRRDDGLLPRPTVMKAESESPSEFYSFNHHRALIGQELLLCFGYPIWRLDFRSVSDAEAAQLAVRSAAVPAVGICMAAMLAVVELPGKEKRPEKHIAHLLGKVEVKEEKPDVSSEPQVLVPLLTCATVLCAVPFMAPKKKPAAKPSTVKKRPASAKPTQTAKRPATALKGATRISKVSTCPHSVANFSEAVVERMDIQLKVDFDRQVLAGVCQLSVRVIAKNASHVILDVLALAIESVVGEDGQPVVWKVEDSSWPKSQFGQALCIELPQLPRGKNVTTFSVKYETTEKSTALQWLTKEQTQGKEYPLCFTQSQAICGRSILPCQDTPSVKSPFSISVTVPTPLTAVASGNPCGDPVSDGAFRTFVYEQKVPVMSYLIAIVVAHLDSCDIGPRSKCYAEPGVIKAAQKEFQDIVEEFIVTAQEVVGGAEYEWGSYNVAVMPSSFAYGGMENPNCTFMSASLIPGDRSLTPTLAHEIVHSWIGNLVTNALWKDFWLNEGKIYGPAFRGLLLLVGYNDLIKAVDMLTKQGTPGLTRLEPEIDDIDPDDAFSRVPYEKGSLFLFYLEQIVGGEQAMTGWLRAYVESFRERSIQTSDVKRHFLDFFKGVERVKEIDWEHWLHGEGLPDFNLADYVDRSLVDESKSLADSWLNTSTSEAETSHMKAQQWMLFLDHLINAVVAGKSISHSTLENMDSKYKISATSNVEVSFRWCLLGCKLYWPGCLALTEHFLANHGRGVYVKPLGCKLADQSGDFRHDCEDVNRLLGERWAVQFLHMRPLYLAFKAFDLERARTVFQRNRNFYMTVAQAVQAKTEDLHVALDEDGARLESKAAALLNLVSHGAFASRSDVMQAPAKRDAANSIFSALSAVAKTTEGDDQVQEKTGTKRKEPEPEEDVPMGLLPIEEPLDWQVRLRKLKYASSALAPMSLDTVLKWIKEAVEDPDAELSRDVIRTGVAELQRRVSKGEPVSEAVFRSRHDLINKLKESGLADLAEEVDIAMRASQLAKGFARNVQQACLDGQTTESMDHYVKTVVRGCDRKGWMMRRIFMHHLSQIAARSLKAGDQDAADKAEQSLIDFGTVGGWPYIISWLKETPDPAKWPSPEVLDQLGSCLPSRTPAQLFAALYAILSSPKLGHTPKSLVRIEKILARNVSQAFDLSTVEHSMPLIKEIAASCPIISDRFKTVLKLLAVAMEVREASGKLQSETWQKLLEKIQDLRAAVAVKTSKGWQQLTMSEVDFVEELKEVAERSLKMAMENEEVMRQKQELVQHGHVQERLEQCRLAVLAVANEDGLKEKTKAGLKRCLIKMKNLHEAMQKVEVPSPFCTEAWNIGRAAIQDFSESDLRCSKAFQWLREKNLGFCARLLDSCGLLERLHLIRESPQKLDNVRLPYRCCELLLATAERDALSKDTFAPKLEEVPAGWEQNTSRHLNLQYFQKEGQMQWEWPLPSNVVPWRNDGGVDRSTSEQWQQQDEDHAIPEAKHFAISSSMTDLDECPYKEGGRCLLCLEDFDDEHQSSSMHGQHMKFWKQITDRMAMICLDLEKLPQDGYRQIGLASAWRGELWQALRVSPAPPKSVLAPFWQRVVLQHLAPADSTSKNDRETAAGLHALLKKALKAARGGGNESQETSLEAEKEISAAVASLDKRVSGLTNISITPAVAALKDLRLAVISSSLYSSSTRSSILDHALKALRQAEAEQNHCFLKTFYLHFLLHGNLSRAEKFSEKTVNHLCCPVDIIIFGIELGTAWTKPRQTSSTLRIASGLDDLQSKVVALQKSKSKAEQAIQKEREALQKEKLRLAEESQALVARQQQLMEAAEEMSSSSGQQEREELIASVNREKAALAREREQLKRQAEAIQAARQQLVTSMNRGQEVEDLRLKAQELEGEADALRRERAALEAQRRRIQAEAEEWMGGEAAMMKDIMEYMYDIAEEREILEEKAKKIHRAVSRGNKAVPADKDLLESLRAAEKQLAQQSAEFRNFKWRVESESKSIEERALAKAAKPLLLVLDDLNRAKLAGAAKGPAAIWAHHRNCSGTVNAKGLAPEDVKQVLRPLRRRLGVLESEFNVRPMPNSVGQAFNPELHEAISLREDDEVDSDIVVEQLEEGFLYGDSSEAAIEQFCSQPAFHVVVQSWLKEKRLESCLPLLSHRGVLTAIAKGEAVKADAAHGLPTHFSETLSEAWHSEGALRLLRPRRSPPDDWELVFSRSVGLFYYCHKTTDGRAQWPYPVLAENETKGNLAEVPNILNEWTRGKPVAGNALYAEIASKGEPICLLCKGQGLEHFASAGHSENIAIWSSIQSSLSEVERDLNVQSTLVTSASSLSSYEMAALAKANVRGSTMDLVTLTNVVGSDQAMEEIVVDEEKGRYARAFAWFRLFKLWGGLRIRNAWILGVSALM